MKPFTSIATILVTLIFSFPSLGQTTAPLRSSSTAFINYGSNTLTNFLPAQCNGSWTKTRTGQSNKKRVTLTLQFQQYSSGPYNITTLRIGVSVKQKKLGFWVNATADEIRVTGAFSGPRSPRDQSSNYGYFQPNPFDVNYSSPIIHFTDYSATSLDCYSMTSAIYTATAYFSGTGTSTEISW